MSIGFFAQARQKDRVLGHFGWDGEPVTVRTNVRPDGSIRDGVDFFDRHGHLLYSTLQEIGTLDDALAAFAAWQDGLNPGPVYPGGENGESADAERQVDRMQARDPMARIGLYGIGVSHHGIHGR
ncbi:MAG: hypothetical protein M0Z36_10955 [Thermaerobacter sp.]|nr:hypothetical protein [Thermaerobacter sp.]